MMDCLAATAADFSTIKLLSPTISEPIRIRPTWLPKVERRIRNSIAAQDPPSADEDGQAVASNIAMQAMSFFQKHFDMLPGEPYLYSSLDGDLIADFKSRRGSMSLIFGATTILGFADAQGSDYRRIEVNVRQGSEASIRRELQHLTTHLQQDKHGAVVAKK